MTTKTVTYRTPHALFHPEFMTHIVTEAAGRRTVIVSANAQHVQYLKQQIAVNQVANITVMTVQAFLIRQLNLQRPRKVLNATSRAMIVQQAWQRANGALWHAYGNNRGALREIGKLLSWVSSQRTQWQQVDADLDTTHEVGAIYNHYVTLMDEIDVIGYDDVALHVSAHPLPTLEYEYIVACELHHAQPAQLAALARYAAHYDMWCGGWILHDDDIPEQRALLQWLTTHAPPSNWDAPAAPGSSLVMRMSAQPTLPLSSLGLIGTRRTTQTDWPAGAATIVDECQAVAHHCHQLLQKGRSVQIVCADESLIPHVRAALIQQGISLPPLAPPDFVNPIINLARIALRWIESTDASEQQRLIQTTMMLPFVGVPAGAARTYSADAQHPHTRLIRDWFMGIDITKALAPQLRQLLNHSGAIMWAWESSTHQVDVRDSWLRDTRLWLERIDEIDQIAQQHQLSPHQRNQLLLGVDALPAPMRELHRSTIPLTITSTGAHAAHDCVIVMGLSEHIAPRTTQGFQLIDEASLCAVFKLHCRPSVPALTHPTAWQQREQRRFMSLIASHAQHIVLSFAHYGANGQAQLATPFLARLLEGYATFDRDGALQVQHPSITCVQTLPLPQARETTESTTQSIQLLTNNTFSASQISTYLTCPRQYYYAKVIQLGHDDESEVDERNLDMGALAHEVLCAVLGNGTIENVDLRSESLEAYRARLAVMPQRLESALQAAWHGHEVPLLGGGTYRASIPWHQRFGTGLRLRSNWLRIHSMLQRWWQYEQELSVKSVHRRPILLEHQLDFSIEGMRIVGRIDRIDMIHTGSSARYEIIDYKSGKPKDYSELLNGFVKKDGKELSNFQIPIYLLGLNQPGWQLTPAAETLTMFYLGQSEKNSQLRIVHVGDQATGFLKAGNSHIGLHIAKNDLHGVIQQDLLRIMHQMRHTPYPAKPSRSCMYCPFTQICDESQY